MARKFTTIDGKSVTDGATVRLTVLKGENELTYKGTVRAFDHVERVYDDEGIAIGKTSEERWEISTTDPMHPAIGLVPENVKTAVKV